MSTMTHDEIELSMFLDLPVADGLDAVEEALTLYRSSRGESKESARKILTAMKLMFSKLGPKCKSASRWEALRHQIIDALG